MSDVCADGAIVLINKGGCGNCVDATLDTSCPGGTTCLGECISCYRTASPCLCSCADMLLQVCVGRDDPIEDCNCGDETTRAGDYITSVHIGWIAGTTANTLADIALLTAPEDPRVLYYLYGSLSVLKCVTSLSDFTRIPWGGPGVYELIDVAPASSSGNVCFENGVHLSVENGLLESALGIKLTDDPNEPGTNCNQEGGYPTLIFVAKNTRCETLVMCPLVGSVGSTYICARTCCTWSEVDSSILCDEDGGVASIELEYTLLGGCDCVPETTVVINVNGTDTTYTLDHSPYTISQPVTPCFPGVTLVTVIITQTYSNVPDGCTTDCPNTSVTRTFTL